MQNVKRKPLFCLTPFMLALALAGCSDPDVAPRRGEMAADAAAAVPQSPRLQEIRRRGTLRVAAVAEFPFLLENISGDGDRFSGPAWILAEEYARRLGVSLEILDASHETKIPVTIYGQADITIAPIWVTEQRAKIIDFVPYAESSLCLMGLKANSKLAGVTRIAELNRRDITIAYFAGGPTETKVKALLPDVHYRAVPGTGGAVPIEEIKSRRADIVPVDRPAWARMRKKFTDLKVIPDDKLCLQSRILANPVGMAIAKGDPAFQRFLVGVVSDMRQRIEAEERRVMEAAS